MTSNIERAAEVIQEFTGPGSLGKNSARAIAQALADAGLLIPDLPGPRRTDHLEMFWIPFEEDQDEYFDIWVSGPGFLKVDGSRRWRKQLTPENARSIAFALLAAADHAEQEQNDA